MSIPLVIIFNLIFDNSYLINDFEILIVLVSVAIILSIFSLDLVRGLSIRLNAFDRPNERSSHQYKVPTLGGLAIGIVWFSILLVHTILFVEHISSYETYSYMLMGLCIVIIGIYDDIKGIKPLYKFFVQLFVFYLLTRLDNSLITSFYGLFNIYELDQTFSLLFSCFVFIGIVNSINLVDGIDGLSSSLTLFFIFIFSYLFYLSGQYYYHVLLPFASTIIVFLTYNFSNNKKMFLGDTGSLGFGLLIATISLGALNSSKGIDVFMPINPALFVVLCLSYPLLDVIRVFVLRLYKGKSPFEPDRSHLHHILIDKGFSHSKSVIIIISFQAFLLLFNLFIIKDLVFHNQLIVNIIVVGLILYLLKRI